MRLFLAIDFAPETRAEIFRLAGRVHRAGTRGGSFVPQENLHLTLAFLGQLPEDAIDGICHACDGVDDGVFDLELLGLGRFGGPGGQGDTLWLGVEPCPRLHALHRQLSAALRARGFRPESRPFRPHITLARRVMCDWPRALAAAQPLSPDGPRPIAARADNITLFRSDRAKSGMVYTPLFVRKL